MNEPEASNPVRYQAYLLRLWQEDTNPPGVHP